MNPRGFWAVVVAVFISSLSVFAALEEIYPDDWTDPNDPTYQQQYPHGVGQIAGKDVQVSFIAILTVLFAGSLYLRMILQFHH